MLTVTADECVCDKHICDKHMLVLPLRSAVTAKTRTRKDQDNVVGHAGGTGAALTAGSSSSSAMRS